MNVLICPRQTKTFIVIRTTTATEPPISQQAKFFQVYRTKLCYFSKPVQENKTHFWKSGKLSAKRVGKMEVPCLIAHLSEIVDFCSEPTFLAPRIVSTLRLNCPHAPKHSDNTAKIEIFYRFSLYYRHFLHKNINFATTTDPKKPCATTVQ